MKNAQKVLAQLSLLVLASGALLLAGCETPSGGGSAGGNNNLEALKAAASGGDADAAYKLGEIYLHGRGVPKNFVEAENWHKRAAELYQKQ